MPDEPLTLSNVFTTVLNESRFENVDVDGDVMVAAVDDDGLAFNEGFQCRRCI